MGIFDRWFGGGGESVAHDDLEPGMVFKVRGGGFSKVVKVERDGVHVVDASASKPIEVDGMTFEMGGMHMPISRGSWEASRPKLVRTEPVEEHELEGYEEWRSAGGGWF